MNEVKLYTDNEIAAFDFIKVVNALPEEGLPNKIYLVPKIDTQTQDLFDEYVWVNNAWEWITTKQLEIDLNDYAAKSDIPTKTSELTNDSDFVSSTVVTTFWSGTQEEYDALENKETTTLYLIAEE